MTNSIKHIGGAFALALLVTSMTGPAFAQDTSTSGKAKAERGRPAPEVLPPLPDGKGRIIFWRSARMLGGAMGCGVNLGSERISALGAGKYFVLDVAPGTYEFNARSETTDFLKSHIEAGETEYVKCTLRLGVMVGRPNLSPSTAEEFGAKRAKLKYVDSDDVGAKVRPDPGATAIAS